MTSARLAAFAVLLLLLFGCVNESNLFPQKEKIADYKELDTNADGDVDSWSYSFEPANAGQNVTVTRTMLVSETDNGSIYSVQTYLLLNTSNASASSSNIVLAELISADLATSPSEISFEPNYTSQTGERPLVFEWKFRTSGTSGQFITYSLSTSNKIDRAWIEDNVLTPSVSVSAGNPLELFSPVFSPFLNLVASLTPSLGFYPAVALIVAITLVLAYLVWTILRLIYQTVLAIKDRKKFIDMVYDFAGPGQKNNVQYIIVGAVLIGLGLASAYLLPSAAAQAPAPTDIGALTQVYAANPIKAFGSLLLLLGILAIFFVLEDVIKGLALGKRYFEAVRAPAELARAIRESEMLEHIEHNRDEVGQMLQKIESLAAAGFNFEDELAVLQAVIGGLDKAEEKAMKKDYAEARGLMVEARLKFDSSHAATLKKIAAATKASTALAALYSAKSDVDVLFIEARKLGATVAEAKGKYADLEIDEAIGKAKDLASEGRFDAAEKEFVKLKYELDLIVASLSQSTSKKKVVKMAQVSEAKLDAVLKPLTSSGKIDAAAIVRRDGLMIYSRLPADVDKNVIAAMSARMMDRAEMVSSELKRGDVRYIMAESTLGKIIAMDVEGMAVLICMLKPKGDLGFAVMNMESAARTLTSLFEGE
ncbi:MAG: roadblock/LC7 domain-containing protein [Candidatus Burarchaeum sp.]|nr:roadblock/LC7 domain-containing protein [Candidatus Burarchaeum sp.]MDO8339128.1 roadblock/LC7 domain-containing protein [Candidatus Burarchaeum sp.]